MKDKIKGVLKHMNNYYIAIDDIADILYGYKCNYRYSDDYNECVNKAKEIVNEELSKRCVINNG